MFANLKNKIKEEIGSDVSTVVRNAGTVRTLNNRHFSQVNTILVLMFWINQYLLIDLHMDHL